MDSNSASQAPNRHVLYTEHLLLGSTFDGEGRPARYAGEAVSPASGRTCLADLTHARVLLFSGPDAPSFAQAAFGGAVLGAGRCALEAVLVGDGSVASVPLLARTGTQEYVAIDFSRRADVLDGWLSFLSGIEQAGIRPYGRMHTEDATRTHVVLGLWGPKAAEVLADYAPKEALPREGEVRACNLDNIPCVVACLFVGEERGFLVLVPPAHAVALWRSLLSFTEVSPVGTEGFRDAMAAEHPWAELLGSTDPITLGTGELLSHGLVRTSADFVGARALLLAEGGEA